MATYNVYNDPGHGWLKVSKKKLAKLGIADKITIYSYQRGDYAYLEEDCDFSTFVNAAKATGEVLKFKDHHTNKQSKIRSYDSYSVTVK